MFSVADELSFHSLRSVFRTGLVDPALLNAVMLSLAFAVTGGSIDQECFGYQGQAISCIHEKTGCLDEAMSESAIGAILLLAGVEVREPYYFSRLLRTLKLMNMLDIRLVWGWRLRFNFTCEPSTNFSRYVERKAYISRAESNGPDSGESINMPCTFPFN